jgi:acetyl/propionyl-CoA carboxylase alpha subunit/acetyl-CoA carboxylase carboxyltransferase component
MKRLLVANRGEVAVRIARTAAEMGISTVAVYSEDDVGALHTLRADAARPLRGTGAAAYLDGEQIVAAAHDAGCDVVHPGYGFLSENAEFARRCADEGLVFVGPRPETLEIVGDKTRARALAASCGVPILVGTGGPVTAGEAQRFFSSLPAGAAMVLKAVAGGGGRGMRVVHGAEEISEAHARCESEARQAFGTADVYAEQFLPRARHVEVQILGDAAAAVIPLGERECSLQRRHQKLIEIAPCPSLSPDLRTRLTADAVRLANAVGYRNAGTFEFLVDSGATPATYAFIEANPRLQVEHTVTEEVLGLDLVRLQLEVARGGSLAAMGLSAGDPPRPRGFAIQMRVNCETVDARGHTRPSIGTLTAFEPPAGPGVRVDTAAFAGQRTSAAFDSLLAKVVVHAPAGRFGDAVARARRALSEFRIEGVRTNVHLLRALLERPEFPTNHIHTQFLDDHLEALVERAGAIEATAAPPPPGRAAGGRVDPNDPLAVLVYGKGDDADQPPGATPSGSVAVLSAMPGTIVSLEVAEGDSVREGQALLVMSAMKMEHVVEAPAAGVVARLRVAAGDTVAEGHSLASIEPSEVAAAAESEAVAEDLGRVRPDLAEVERRRALTLDPARPDAVARRRKTGQRTARENIADLCDPGTFVEYGRFVIAAQRQRRSLDDLIERTPADGLVAGIGRVNGDLFGEERSRCVVLSYDYTVLAGTQGFLNHRKKDRMFELAERLRLPVVFFTEGGGGRPGDTDAPGVAGLDCMAFNLFAGLSGLVPLVGINSGRCFAGNAALLGCCDAVIATRNSNIGMGGPAMIEGGGLGVYRPEEVGPMDVQVSNGVVDIAVADEAEAVRAARRYLSYFQGSVGTWEAADQRRLRSSVPENRLRIYEVRSVIETLADAGSVLELRREFGGGMVTALARIEGRPVGIVANNPRHLAGAIDSPGADKASRFMQLCDAFDLPILFLCDTPGIMVGPEVEKTALVRHCCRMFVTGASLTVPFFTIVLRKSYGLGAQAMGGGSHKAPVFTVSWPTGEFGGMGLEGAVKLGFRKELAAIENPEERRRAFEHMVGRAYEHGKALNSASHFEIDDVIDPAESRPWVASQLRSLPPPPRRERKKRPCIDTW